MQDDDPNTAPADDNPQAEVKQSEVTTPETGAVTDTGAEGDQPAEGDDAKVEGDDPDKEQEEKPKRRSGIDRLKRRISDLEAENNSLRSRDAPASAGGAGLDAAIEKEIGAPPKHEDFDDYFAFERAATVYEIKKDRVANDIKGREAESQARASACIREMVEDFDERCAEAATSIADYDEVVKKAEGTEVSDAVLRLVVESDKGALLKYHLAKNPGELASLNAMDPLTAARAIGRLEARLSLPNPKKTTEAPAPKSPLKGSAGPTSQDAKLDAWMDKTYGKRA